MSKEKKSPELSTGSNDAGYLAPHLTPKVKSTIQPKVYSRIQPKLMTDPVQKKNNENTASNKLPDEVQAKMENGFGQDFSDVNVHTNSQEAENLGAKAFAQGTDIHFASGFYNPSSKEGQELIGHELTHVIQQKQGRVQPSVQHKKSGIQVNEDKSLENEADLTGAKVANDEKVSLGKVSNGISSGIVQNKKIVQRNPIAALGAGEWIAIGAMGYTVAQDAVSQKAGDISYSFDEVEGVKFPNEDVEKYKKLHKYPITRTSRDIAVWVGTGSFRKAGIKFRVTYEHDGYSLGNVSCTIVDSYDWVSWGGSVNVNFTGQSIVRGGAATIRMSINLNSDSLIGSNVDSGIFTIDGANNITHDESTTYFWYEIS